MLRYLDELFSDPRGFLLVFLLALPARILSLSLHEFGHAWVANRCGDPTAKMLGRLTLNPLKHLDPMGTILMLLLGFGWAKPVPVNPRNYRNYRRDDLLVSIAGVTMNLILFFVSLILMFAIVAVALGRLSYATAGAEYAVYRAPYGGAESVIWLENGEYYYMPIMTLLRWLPSASEALVTPLYGEVAGYLYQMLAYFSLTNLVLFLFNLLPVPPLDGYHVLNDLFLRRGQLFANPNTVRIASTALFVLSMTGYLGKALGWVETQVFSGVGSLAAVALRAMGLMT